MNKKEDPTMLFWAMGGGTPKTTEQHVADREKISSEEKKKDLSLGELNPLIHFPELHRRESVEALKFVIQQKIEKYGGVVPIRLESSLVCSMRNPNVPQQLRFIAKFEVNNISGEQMNLLEKLVKDTYGVKVRTSSNSEGKSLPMETYPPINSSEYNADKTSGWYMGINQDPTDSLHTGLFVFKNLGPINRDNFLDTENANVKFIVEVREAAMYQTDMVEFVTQVSSILGSGKILNSGELTYEVYYDLLRLGLKEVSPNAVYGMDTKLDEIRNRLVLPLASPELSKSFGLDPESVILIGVPGTGKTLIVQKILQEETGVFILPLDPLELTKELLLDKTKQKILPRIAEVAKKTGKPIILHIDDIENMVNESNTHSTILNLMAGVSESGFHIIASTNYPEKISDALFQPQRFGIRLYCGLQNHPARNEILKIHAIAASLSLGIPLFSSESERERILSKIADKSEYFTPRYLWEIANAAKSFLAARIARARGSIIGITEKDFEGHIFTEKDFDDALDYVRSIYDVEATKKRDEALRKFVSRANSSKIGFLTPGSKNE